MSDLEAVEADLKTATPGPWASFVYDREYLIKQSNGPCVVDAIGLSKADARLIANAPMYLAELVQEVKDLRAHIERWASRDLTGELISHHQFPSQPGDAHELCAICWSTWPCPTEVAKRWEGE